MALKYIEKKSIAKLPPASGSVSDTLNVTDKVTNAPSIRLVEEIVENMTGSSAIEVPKKTSDLENDSGFITADDIPEVNVPTKVSQLENDTGYITNSAVPKKTSQLTNDSGFITADEIPDVDVDVPTKVSELENDKGYITADEIPDVEVPTKTSELTNDSGFITSSSVPTKVSQLTNDKGYITASDIPDVDVPTKTSDLENDSGFITADEIPDIGGAGAGVSDTLEVEDKTTVAPSIRLAEAISGVPTETIIAFDGTEDEVPDGFEVVEDPNLVVYSTEEYFTGKYWIDGKKIYGKCFLGTLSGTINVWTNIQHNIANVDMIWIERFDYKYKGAWYKLPNDVCIEIGADSTTYKYYIVNQTLIGLEQVVVLEYTKTTD